MLYACTKLINASSRVKCSFLTARKAVYQNVMKYINIEMRQQVALKAPG
jgi:hypothetical protein